MGIVLGLTGGSGTGKSLAAGMLEKKGALIIDADKIAREVTAPNMPCLREIASAFGEDMITEEGFLNRKKLAAIVFSQKDKLALLNRITHGYIKKEIESRLHRENSFLTVIDAPLLFEASLDLLCNHTLGILAEKETRLKRIMARDALTKEEALARIEAQKTKEFYTERCDYCIENDGDEKTLATALSYILKELSLEEEKKEN